MIKTVFILLITILFYSSVTRASDLNEKYNSNLCKRYLNAYEKKYNMPRDMLKAIALTESGKWSKLLNKKIMWPWTINVEGKGYQFDNRYQAIKAVKHFQNKGITSIDVGCMQINLKYHPEAFRTLNQAFEPRYNIGYAAKVINNKYSKNGDWETAIRHYHNVHEKYSDKYLKRVYENWGSKGKNINLAMVNYTKKYNIMQNNKDSAAEASKRELMDN